MKAIVCAAAMLLASPAFAAHLDVIQSKIKPDCSVAQYVAIMNDFNSSWGRANGYHAEMAVPLQSDSFEAVFWLGRSANAAAFGKAWDTWRDALANPESVPAKLQARFDACTVQMSRRGYDIY